MKRYLHILFIVLSLMMSSCEYELDHVRGVEDKGMLCIRILSGLADTTVISVSPTIPVGEEVSELAVISRDDILMTINGEPVEIMVADGETTSYEEGTLYTDAPIRPGDRLAAYAAAPGYDIPPVNAETVVPQEVPEFTVAGEKVYYDIGEYLQYSQFNAGSLSWLPEGNFNEAVRLKVSFMDDPDHHDRYAVELRRYHGNRFLDEGFLLPISSMFSVESGALPIFSLDDIFTYAVVPYMGTALTYFTDKGCNGQEITKEYMMQYQDGCRYVVRLFKLSEELFRAAESYFTYISGYYRLDYFAIYYPYTNVHGGTGCFASATMRESDLLEFDF